ncbi:MAG: glycosyltransferase family 2 protein [Oscillospiraceae bacterium]
MAKISIIVPIYNVEKYLEKSLNSFVNQTMEDIEIIIVDDGSPDESYKIYERFAENDPRIKIIKKKNGGVSAARNTGLENATGEFVMFADSDDWMELNCCESMYAEQQRTNADMVLADVIVETNGHPEINHIFKEEFVKDDPKFFMDYQKACIGYSYNPMPSGKWKTPGLGSPWNKLFRRSLIESEKLRFDPYVNGIYDDNLFTLHYLMHIKKISYIQVPVYTFRIVSESITQAYKPNTLETNLKIFERINDFMAETGNKDYFEEAFYVYVIRRLSKSLNVYFFSAKNPTPINERLAELKNTLNSEPYKTAIRKVDINRLLNNHKVVCLLSRIGSPNLLYAAVKIKNLIK